LLLAADALAAMFTREQFKAWFRKVEQLKRVPVLFDSLCIEGFLEQRTKRHRSINWFARCR